MRSLVQFLVFAVTVVTLTLAAAVGVSAGSGTFGGSRASATVAAVLTPAISKLGLAHDIASATSKGQDNKGQDSKGKDNKKEDECKAPKKHHKEGTPGHEHDPCGDDNDKNDND